MRRFLVSLILLTAILGVPLLASPVANAAVVQVNATVETDPIRGSGDTGGSSIVRESVSQATNTTATTTLKIPRPIGVAQGDVLVSCVSLNGGSIAATGVPTGWVPLAEVTTIANPKVYGYYKVATGSEPTDYVWTTSSTTSGGGIARYSGASGLDTAATSASGAAASSGTIPAVTSTTSNAMLVGCMSVNSGSVTLTSPNGMSQVVETGARRFEVADGIQAIAGPSGAKTWQFSAAREWAGWLVALRPKTAPPPSAPVASFTATPTSGIAPLNVAFTDTSTGSPTSWSWAFGDGGTSSDQNPAHTYTAAGTYTATLTATNGTGSSSTSSTITVSPAAAGTVPTYDHIVIVIMENESYQNVIGNSTAPYINSIANSIGVNLTNAYAEAHPSQPNYLALFSGSTQGVTDDSSSSWPFTGPNMYSQLVAAGKTFSGYSEGLISGVNWLAYHSPWLHWTGVPASAGQDWTAFPTDYTKLPNVSIVAPDSCNSMHDCSINTGDTWLRDNLGAYATWAKTHNSLLYVTFDEDGGVGGATSVNHIPAVMIGASLDSPGSYGTTFNHYGVLGMVEDSNGLPRLNSSGGAAFPTTAFSTTTSTAPVASFTATPTSGTAPLAVSFTDTSTGTPTSWSWDFGDTGTSTAQNPTHTYTAAGTYTATLTATNSGGSTTATATITVNPTPPAAGITVVGSTTTFSGTALSTVSLTKPSGTAAGDVLIASFTADLNPSAASVPAGWTAIVNGISIKSSSKSGARVFAYYHVVGSPDPASYSWTLSKAVTWGAGVTAYRGVNTATPLDTGVVTAVNTSDTATSITAPSITTASNGAMLIGGVGFDSSTPAAAPPSGWTERWEAAGGQIAEQADRSQATAGATGTATWTFSTAKAVAAWRTALKPAT
jgi:PKD repeat protein